MKEIAHHEYKRFKWKRMHVANITKVLNEGNACRKHDEREYEIICARSY